MAGVAEGVEGMTLGKMVSAVRFTSSGTGPGCPCGFETMIMNDYEGFSVTVTVLVLL